MAFFEREAVRIHYDVQGEGFAVLCLAPGGLRSSAALWRGKPIDAPQLLAPHFRVVTMDQRNAGRSYARLGPSDSWSAFAQDQLELMTHLGIDRFAVVGMCIGGSFISELTRIAPERIAGAVMLQPIGCADNREVFKDLVQGWWDEIAAAHPEIGPDWLPGYKARLFDGDFQFNASERDAQTQRTPLLLLRGDDIYHPATISDRLAELWPGAEYLREWKSGPACEAASQRMVEFLRGVGVA